MIYKDGCEYTCTHWWYDSQDNDYEVIATWVFEKNYPEMPDHWHLQGVDFDVGSARSLANKNVGEILSGCRNGGNIWCWVESQGPDESMLEEVDYA